MKSWKRNFLSTLEIKTKTGRRCVGVHIHVYWGYQRVKKKLSERLGLNFWFNDKIGSKQEKEITELGLKKVHTGKWEHWVTSKRNESDL